MKKLIAAALVVGTLVSLAGTADARPHRHRVRVCTMRHHHRVCSLVWR